MEEFKNGFRQAVLCVERFWDSMDIYNDNPIIRRLDPVTKRELKWAMSSWIKKYFDEVLKNES